MESTDKREWSQYYHFEKDTSGKRWQRSTTTNSWSSKWIRRCHVNSAVWRQRPPRRQQYRNEPGLSHVNGAGMSRRRSTSVVSCIESSAAQSR